MSPSASVQHLKTYARQTLRKSPLLHAVVDAVRGKTVVTLDYPLRQDPRWGFGRPEHHALGQILRDQRDGFARRLSDQVELEPYFRRIGQDTDDEVSPAWRNDFSLPGMPSRYTGSSRSRTLVGTLKWVLATRHGLLVGPSMITS